MKKAGFARPRRMSDWVRRRPYLRNLVVALAGAAPYRYRENLRQWFLHSVHEADFLLFDLTRKGSQAPGEAVR